MLAQIGAPGLAELIIILLVIALIVGTILLLAVLPFWLICVKAGFPGWYSLAMLFPILHIILPFYLAFAEWPALRQRRGPEQEHE